MKKNKKKFNYVNILISLLGGVLISMLSLPVHVTGGFRGTTFYARTNIITFLDTLFNHCTDCYYYGITWTELIVQATFTFLIIYLIINIIDKKRRKKL